MKPVLINLWKQKLLIPGVLFWLYALPEDGDEIQRQILMVGVLAFRGRLGELRRGFFSRLTPGCA
jgi:hypothetical protein